MVVEAVPPISGSRFLEPVPQEALILDVPWRNATIGRVENWAIFMGISWRFQQVYGFLNIYPI
jgi:hypothetical protein